MYIRRVLHAANTKSVFQVLGTDILIVCFIE